MSVRAEAADKTIVVVAPLTYATRMKEVPGGRYDSRSKSWRYPLTWAHCVMLRGTFGSELIVGPDLKAWAADEVRRRVTPAMEAKQHG